MVLSHSGGLPNWGGTPLEILYDPGERWSYSGEGYVFLARVIQRQTGLTRGNLSSHLNKLEDAGYVEIEKEFVDKIPRTLLKLTGSGRNAFRVYRTTMQQVLGSIPD